MPWKKIYENQVKKNYGDTSEVTMLYLSPVQYWGHLDTEIEPTLGSYFQCDSQPTFTIVPMLPANVLL